MSSLAKEGWLVEPSGLGPEILATLRRTAFDSAQPDAGQRCLLDQPAVATAAKEIRTLLISRDFLTRASVAVQAIAFDKTPGVNWKVTWHQDVLFPFAAPTQDAGYELPCVKDGIPYARPPRDVLEHLLAVRLHLDDCHEENGPLRVISGSHTLGVLKAKVVSQLAAAELPVTCLANEGDVLLMKPLLLQASSPATEPSHRRVLHIVFYDGPPLPERWYRVVS
jgi:ectoine hydroxylase-related dioxygenase (phytanoyl-CoA dioxygenase family)